MISRTGSNQTIKKASRCGGFTFIEVMVTLVILSVGIVGIFKSLIYSLDKISYLTNRLYATTTIENKVIEIEHNLILYKALPIELEQIEVSNESGGRVEFSPQIKFNPVDQYLDLFQLTIDLSWMEGQLNKTISRSAYIADFTPAAN